MEQHIKFDYFYGKKANLYSFYRVPKLLFTEPMFKELSCEAKILYGLMLDRMSLSIKNAWLRLVPDINSGSTFHSALGEQQKIYIHNGN